MDLVNWLRICFNFRRVSKISKRFYVMTCPTGGIHDTHFQNEWVKTGG
jgi:hypothetical protein